MSRIRKDAPWRVLPIVIGGQACPLTPPILASVLGVLIAMGNGRVGSTEGEGQKVKELPRKAILQRRLRFVGPLAIRMA